MPSKRIFLWLVSFIALMIIVLRLVTLQLWQGETYRARADDNRFHTLPVWADRGAILDRYGQPLAQNDKRYYQLSQPDVLYAQRQPISRDTALELMATQSALVSWEPQRRYPVASATAHVVGYVGKVTAEELAANPDVSLSKLYGKSGLEKTYDSQLQGQDGQRVYEVNALGQRQRLISETSAVPGESLQTTLDPDLSQVALQALGSFSGAVLVADASNGEILALVSQPSFDPNSFSNVYDNPDLEADRVAEVKSWFADQRQPLFDRAVSGVYPPGSVFKIVTALAGLETGALGTQTQVDDQGVLKVGEYQYGNWYFRQYGRTEGLISLVRALARSNDIYFYKAAEWIGPDKLAEFARLFGLGQVIDIGIYPSAKGIVPDPAWKLAVIGERWYLGNTYHLGIGQGDLLVSPLQMLQLLLAVGHDGTLCRPSLVRVTGSECAQLGLQSDNITTVLQGMIEACSPGGTAFPFFERNGRVLEQVGSGASVESELAQGAVACKTGTAEFGGSDERGYRKTHGWFVALVEPQLGSASPVANKNFPKRLAIVVLAESDDTVPFKEGSREAAPVAKYLLDWIEGKVAVPDQAVGESAVSSDVAE